MVETKVGTAITLTYSSVPDDLVTVFVIHEDDASTPSLGMQSTASEISTPEGFNSIYATEYTPQSEGIYYVTYLSTATGNAASKFFAYTRKARTEGSSDNYRQSALGADFVEVISHSVVEGIALTGQTADDFSITFFKDGTIEVSPSWTIAEVGTNGDYVLTILGGLPSEGHWVITVLMEATNDTWRTDVEVRKEIFGSVTTSGSPF
jgi:hypothetical protein